jgi:hypothetical protein
VFDDAALNFALYETLDFDDLDFVARSCCHCLS